MDKHAVAWQYDVWLCESKREKKWNTGILIESPDSIVRKNDGEKINAAMVYWIHVAKIEKVQRTEVAR